MLNIIRRHNFAQIYSLNYNGCARLIHNSIKADEDGELMPGKARIVICGSGLAGSRYEDYFEGIN